MCKLKSAIILKNKIFMPDYDSHTDMLRELGIKDDYLGASKKFVRAELFPNDGDVFSDIDNWRFKVDQDIVPDWFDENKYIPLMREKVKEWAKTHIHIGVDDLIIDSGSNHFVKDCKNVKVYGNATVNEVCGNATVNEVCGNATVIGSKYTKWNNHNKIILCDNATFKDCYTKTIYQSGDWKLVNVQNKGGAGE